MHGPGFAEVMHGSKRWFFYPPNVTPPEATPNKTVANWARTTLPLLSEPGDQPLECVILPGEVLYFPHGWHHATLNLGVYTAFASTFIIDE